MSTTTYSARPFTLRSTAPTGQLMTTCLQATGRWIDWTMLDERGRHLAGARDHAELAQREREWDDYQRRCAMFTCPY
jgi:hypothetical protein